MGEDRGRRLRALLASDGQGQAVSTVSLICGRCVSELSVSGAGATVLSDTGEDRSGPRRGLVHASNEVSAGLEDLQLTVGEGPCLDAFTAGGPVLVADLAANYARWPGFTPAALKLGAVAVFSLPLQVGVIRLGTLDLYRDTAGPLSREALTDALILADVATQAVIADIDGHHTHDLGWLNDPHSEIDQATGMAQVQLGTTGREALLRLRAYAYTHELALAEVARQVVARTLRLSPDSASEP